MCVCFCLLSYSQAKTRLTTTITPTSSPYKSQRASGEPCQQTHQHHHHCHYDNDAGGTGGAVGAGAAGGRRRNSLIGQTKTPGCCGAFFDFDDYDYDDDELDDDDAEADYYYDDYEYDNTTDYAYYNEDDDDDEGESSDCSMLGASPRRHHRKRTERAHRMRNNNIRSVLISKRHHKYKIAQPQTRLEVINESERSAGSGSDENDSLLVAYDSTSSLASV